MSLTEGRDIRDKVPVSVDAVSLEMFNGGSDCCARIVVVDLLLMFKSSVPVFPGYRLAVRLVSICWDGIPDPVPEGFKPSDMVPPLEPSCVVESLESEDPPLPGEESLPSKVADVLVSAVRELPILFGGSVLEDRVISVMVEAPKRKDVS